MSAAVNKKAVAQSFSRAASAYDSVAHLQRQAGTQLLAELGPNHGYRHGLDIGCGTGQLTRLLSQQVNQVTALDFAPGMLAFARSHHADVISGFVCADADALPFAPASFDLVFSNFVLQWSESLPRVMAALFAVLQPGGTLAFTIPGERSLWELKHSWCAADPGHQHVNRFTGLPAVVTAVSAAGFVIGNAAQQQQTLYYPAVRDLTRELKTLGAHTVTEGRATHLTGKHTLTRMLAAYESLRTPQGLPASWDIIRVIARKPD